MNYDLVSDAKKVVSEMALRLPGDERKRLISDLERAVMKPANEDGSILTFIIEGYERPRPIGRDLFRVEGTVQDNDGSQLNVMLFSDANGRLLELELVRYDEGSVIKPDWTTLDLS